MSDEQNYATHDGVKVPREDHAWAPEGSSPSEWKLPLDSTHIESALDMYAHAKGIPDDQKHAVAAKIARYAEKHGVAEKKIDAFKEKHLSAVDADKFRQEALKILSKPFTIKLADGSDLSFDRIRELVQAAVDTLYPVPEVNSLGYSWIRDLFPGYAIVSHDGKLMRIPYTIMGEKAVLGIPSEVEQQYVQASAAGSGKLDSRARVVCISLLSLADGPSTLIPILVTGQWVKGRRDVGFTKEELEIAIENFNKLANHDLNVDYDHACEDLERAAGDATPSAGKINALGPIVPFIIPAGPRAGEEVPMLQGTYTPTARARVLIKNREYRYVSAAFAKEYRDRITGESQGLTLTSVALTNQPFLDELPEIWLSIRDSAVAQGSLSSPAVLSGEEKPQDRRAGPALPNSELATQQQNQNRLSAANSGGKMATPNLTLKHSFAADNKTHQHEVYDGDKKVGEIDHDHLTKHAEEFCRGGQMSATAKTEKLSDLASADREVLKREFTEELFSSLGLGGKSEAEAHRLVSFALAPPDAEITILSRVITKEGKLNAAQLDALDDSGKISRDAWRRAKDAEGRVEKALLAGQLTPAMIESGQPLLCALMSTPKSDMFQALVERRPSILKLNTVTGIAGSGSETGESPRQLFSRLVEEKKQQLMQTDTRLGELDAHRKAGALVAKENPDLLKNYRADAKTA